MQPVTLALRPQPHRRQLAVLLGAGVLLASATLVGHAIVDFHDYASDHLVEFSSSYKTIPDVASLTHEADLVIVGKVANDGSTRFFNPPDSAPKSNPAPQAPSASGKKADALKAEAPGSAPTLGTKVVNTTHGTPFTTYDVQIERVLHGNANQGAQIVVTQPGGHVTLDTIPGVSPTQLHRTVEFEHDTLMQAGDEHVMFLKKAADGTFYVVGGPQGRLSLDKSGKVHPIDPSAPALKNHNGRLLESLVGEVSAAK